MKKNISRGLSFLIVIMMLMGILPVGVMAESNGEVSETGISEAAKMVENVEQSIIPETVNDSKVIDEKNISQNDSQIGIEDTQKAEVEKVVELPQLKTEETTVTEKAAEPVQTDATVQEFTYKEVEGGINITKYNGAAAEVTIPDMLDGKKVIGIDSGAFSSKGELRKVTVGNNITTIKGSAFVFCYQLRELFVPKTTTLIEEYTFVECPKMIMIGDKGSFAETYANNKKIIFIDNASKSENGYWYEDVDGGVRIKSYIGSDNEITIPEMLAGKKVVAIGQSAFKNCASITEIILNEGLTSIEAGAFASCTGLKAMKIPDSVTSLGGTYDTGIFAGCYFLTEVLIGKGINTIPSGTFLSCSRLIKVSIPETVTEIVYGAFGTASYERSEYLTIFGASGSQAETFATNNKIAFISYTADHQNGFWFKDVDTGVEVIKYDGTDQIITIPDTFEGKKVISIGEKAFVRNSTATKIVLSNNITSIGNHAFDGCAALTEVALNNGLVTIGAGAFVMCDKLIKITIPDTVTTLGTTSMVWNDGVFGSCLSLESVILGKGITAINNQNFYQCRKLKEVKFNSVIKSIGDSAFYMTGLETLHLPDGLETIGKSAFTPDYSSVGIARIFIPASVTFIDSSAFTFCNNLSIIGTKGSYAEKFAKESSIVFIDENSPNENGLIYETMDGGVRILKYVGENSTVMIPDTIAGEKVLEIGGIAFVGQTQIKKVMLGKNIEVIGNSAFRSCSNLESISLNEGLKSIGSAAFYECKALTTLTIPDSVTALADGDYQTGVFSKCNSLVSLTLGTGITSFPKYMVYGCSKLETVKYNGKIVSIGDAAFGNCSALKMEAFPSTLQTIGVSAFGRCIGLTDITIPDSTTSIGSGAFVYCKQLKNINFGNSLTKIDNGAFSDCYSLEEVSLPSSLKTIEAKDIFLRCTNLKKVVIPQSITSISSNIFSGSSLLSIYGTKGSYAETYAHTYNLPFIDPSAPATNITCSYQTHVQDIGWQEWKTNGAISGTSAQAKRLEGIKIKLDNPGYNLGVEYSTHIENIGWQEPKTNGLMSGTEGKGLRLEAIQIKLTGADAEKFNVYYRVHAQNVGWMDWAKNGQSAGTAGFAYRLEAIEIQVLPKDAAVPGKTEQPFLQK